MALDKSVLKTALESLFTDFPPTQAAAADGWAAAYAAYAANAQSCQGLGPSDLAAAESTLAAALLSSFSGGGSAGGIATALTTFWLSPPVVFLGVTPGSVTAVGGTTALTADLISLWAANVTNKVSASEAAQGHADIFDTFTKTVVVAHAFPSVCSSPIM